MLSKKGKSARHVKHLADFFLKMYNFSLENVVLLLFPPAAGEIGYLHGGATIACRNVSQFYKAAPQHGVVHVHVEREAVAQAVYEAAIHGIVNPAAVA